MAKRKSAFDRCVESVTAKGSADDPRAVCAVAGVRKYGQAEMTRRAIAGRESGRLNPSGKILSGLSEAERYEVVKHSDRTLYQALSEGFDQKKAHELADMAAARKARELRKAKRNPIEEAAALSEAFHGRPAESITEYTDAVHEHTVLADLGRLLRINLDHGVKIKFGPGTRLASNEAGTQLYAVGGDQSVDLDGFDVDETKESVVLGQVKKVVYSTAKYHLGKEDETEGPYVHELGEETGHLPILVYDTVNRLLSFVGGSYHIDIDMDGKYSAGIRD